MFIPRVTHRSRVQPNGRVRPRGPIPRGLVFCPQLNTPDFCNIAPTFPYVGAAALAKDIWPTQRGSAVKLVPTAMGVGAQFDGSASSTNELGYNCQKSSKLSIEFLFRTGSSLPSMMLSNFCNDLTGGFNSNDTKMYFNSSSQLVFSKHDGSHKTAIDTTTAYATNTIYHAVGVADDTNITLFVNGKQMAQTACGLGDLASYATTSGLLLGSCQFEGGSRMAANATLLLVNYAPVVWTDAEVLARAQDPFGFLAGVDDEIVAHLVCRNPRGDYPNAAFMTMFPP